MQQVKELPENGRTQQQDAGRQDAAKWRSIVIQIFQECLDAQL